MTRGWINALAAVNDREERRNDYRHETVNEDRVERSRASALILTLDRMTAPHPFRRA